MSASIPLSIRRREAARGRRCRGPSVLGYRSRSIPVSSADGVRADIDGRPLQRRDASHGRPASTAIRKDIADHASCSESKFIRVITRLGGRSCLCRLRRIGCTQERSRPLKGARTDSLAHGCVNRLALHGFSNRLRNLASCPSASAAEVRCADAGFHADQARRYVGEPRSRRA